MQHPELPIAPLSQPSWLHRLPAYTAMSVQDSALHEQIPALKALYGVEMCMQHFSGALLHPTQD